MNVARTPGAVERRPRAVAIGTFDGVHLGHRAVIRAAVDAGVGSAEPDKDGVGSTERDKAGVGSTEPGKTALIPTVVTFHPHPRTAFGNRVALLTTLERRLELLADCGIEDVLVVEFSPELASLPPEDFAREYLERIGTEVVVAGTGFRFGHERAGDCELLRTLGFDAREVPLVEGISSTKIRQLAAAGDVEGAARLLGRPLEVDGTVVTGDHRGGTLGFPTANLLLDPDLLVPEYGIYAGAVGDKRAAISIGVNPHYGGTERRVEAYLLDWSGDLYGDRLVVELWRRLREERVFESEAELVEQIARDVEETRSAVRPA